MAQEKNFQDYVKTYLKDNNCYTVVMHGDGLQRRGIPDIICNYKSYFLGIELKANNGRPSPLQIYNLQQINKKGAYGILLYKSGFDKFVKFLSELPITHNLHNTYKDGYFIFK